METRQRPQEAPPRLDPTEFTSSDESLEFSEDLLARIDEAQWKGHWTCGVHLQNGACGCDVSTHRPWGAGGTPGHPVSVSKSPKHWYQPVKCNASGVPMDPAWQDKL